MKQYILITSMMVSGLWAMEEESTVDLSVLSKDVQIERLYPSYDYKVGLKNIVDVSHISLLNAHVNVTSLDVTDCGLGDEALSCIIKYMPHLTKLDVSRNNVVKLPIASHALLQQFIATHNQFQGYFDMKNMLTLYAELRKIDLSYNQITSADWSPEDTKHPLRFLSLAHNELVKFDLTPFIDATQISEVDLQGNDCLTDVEFKPNVLKLLTFRDHYLFSRLNLPVLHLQNCNKINQELITKKACRGLVQCAIQGSGLGTVSAGVGGLGAFMFSLFGCMFVNASGPVCQEIINSSCAAASPATAGMILAAYGIMRYVDRQKLVYFEPRFLSREDSDSDKVVIPLEDLGKSKS